VRPCARFDEREVYGGGYAATAVSDIAVTPLAAREFEVTIDGSSRHRVSVPERFGDADLERVVRASFEFLLEREPASSILGEFSLDVIARYFPEYEDELPRRLG
jgi:hypothetical protein